MRAPFLVTSLVLVALAGCSSREDQAVSTRRIQLAEPVPIDSAVASPVETGRAAPAGHASHRLVSAPAPTPAPATARRQSVLEAVAMPAPSLTVTATTPEPGSLGLVTAPARAVVEPAVVEVSESVVQRSGTGWHGMGGSVDHMSGHAIANRGPTIIIRGGMGGIDDKCDLRPRGFAGSGSAVNRLGPSFAGGMGQGRPAVFQRGGQR